MRHYTSTVHAITLCPSISPSQVRALSKQIHGLSWCLAEFILCLSYTVLYRNSGSFKNKGTSFCNLVPNSELSRFFYFFHHSTSTVTSVVKWVLLTTNDHHSLSEWTSTFVYNTLSMNQCQTVCLRPLRLGFQAGCSSWCPTNSLKSLNHWRQWDVDLLVCQHQLQAATCRHCSTSCCYLSTAFGREVVCLNQQSTPHMRVNIIVHNCCTQYGTEKSWLSSLLSSRQSSLVTRCLLEGRVSVNTSKRKLKMRFFGQWWMSTAAAVSQATLLLL